MVPFDDGCTALIAVSISVDPTAARSEPAGIGCVRKDLPPAFNSGIRNRSCDCATYAGESLHLLSRVFGHAPGGLVATPAVIRFRQRRGSGPLR